ncbi:FAD-binding and (Fe-S)-binding domain-containing protein [Leucobacter sp. NPDC015123]|uniref:FAD-binding and (Fe-S)-binding domain-containing protein n=1 Tax=Leucobacter sp. NPDC015123 TaxID=3364129 RepID=UPI0036F49CDE
MTSTVRIDSPLRRLTSGATEKLTRSIDRFSYAHDASHYLLVPHEVLVPQDAEGVAEIFQAASEAGVSVTFRSGGTSLSGQGVSGEILVDTRRNFRDIRVADGGVRVVAEPGATVRQVNTRLLRHGRKLGPDPASEIACTIGGVIANNSSGMACGIEANSYQTVESLLLVLPSGTILDTGDPHASEHLREQEPEIFAGLAELRDELRAKPELTASVQAFFAMKNTMGYGINALLDFDDPVRILEHLVIGSEGTLAFVAEARFATVPILPAVATGLLVFPSLAVATAALPRLVEVGFATIELLDSTSLRVAQGLPDVPTTITDICVEQQAAYLVEIHAGDADELRRRSERAVRALQDLELLTPATLTEDPGERASLWHVRKGLYTAVAGARPSGTTALLEDVVVPVDRLFATCEGLAELFATHGYDDAVIFGHAKDGNIHFMLTERFDTEGGVARHKGFVEDMVELILSQGGSLKAEHGTGRVMAPFVRRQYGDELTDLMWAIKRLIDPSGLLNPGVVLSEEADSYLQHLKLSPKVEPEVDRCVECGYCEPTCPSKDLTLTPRQRIVLRRDIAAAEERGDAALAAELKDSYEYDGVQTCAVDGMCGVACPVGINTGDLVRRLRSESAGRVESAAWGAAAKHWGVVTSIGGAALTVAKATPAPIVRGVTQIGRALLGSDRVPLYDAGLPRGGSSAKKDPGLGSTDAPAEVVFFAACIGEMFGPATDHPGSRSALRSVLDRAGIPYAVPLADSGLCCGTPWKSKGQVEGYGLMSERTLSALWQASREGELPVICDAASCTEGVEVMLRAALEDHPEFRRLRVEDATTFVAREALPKLTRTLSFARIAVHPTCSTTALGATSSLTAIAEFAADEVFVPDEWGCCAFAGDRGMLHPELTESATMREAEELREVHTQLGEFDAYVSANRTCEIGMSRATGKRYRHVIELLEEATR